MRLTNLRLKGLTCFPDEVSLDLEALGPGLVAVVGGNGQGKTTLLESVAAALYLELPSRPGSLYAHAHGRDAFIEASFDLGRATPAGTRARVLIDAEQRKTEAYLSEYDSESSGKTREFGELVAKRFGSREAFLASVFSAQNRAGSFLDASKGERKALFVELLGLGQLQELSEAARERKRTVETALVEARTTYLVIVESANQVSGLQASKVAVVFQVQALNRDLATARETERTLREKAAHLEAAQAKLRGLEQQRSAATRVANQAQVSLDAAQRAPGAARERAQRELGRLDDSLPQTMRESALARYEGHHKQAARNAEAGGCSAEVRHKLACERVELTAKEKEAHAFALFEAARERLVRSSALIGTVPCSATVGSACPLLKDANAAKSELDEFVFVPPDLEGWKAEHLAGAKRTLAQERSDLETQQVIRVDAAKATLEKELLDATAKGEQILAAGVAIRAQLEKDFQDAQDGLTLCHTTRDETWVEKSRLEHEVELVSASLGAVPSQDVAPAFVQLQKEIAKHEQELGDAKQALGGIAAKLKDSLEAEGRAVILDGEIRSLEADLVEWGVLEKALGRDGVQALEIDAAGPAVAGLANELLESCYGPRFSLGFETLREKKSKKGEYTEAFDVQVYDEGTPRTVEHLSGGERVIVGEALGLALALFNAKRSGIHWETLWRDETAGALDPVNAARYVDMLRRARELGGFHQVIFVSHQEQVWERADTRVRVQGGGIAVEA